MYRTPAAHEQIGALKLRDTSFEKTLRNRSDVMRMELTTMKEKIRAILAERPAVADVYRVVGEAMAQ